MKNQIKVSNTLSLPIELAARTQAILAMKGSGKTYLAMKEAEEMLRVGQQVVCLDPTGVFWGLRSSADGKSEGFSIIVMGGDKADVPLEPTAGAVIADFVIDSGQSAILDMSHFESLAAQDRFVTDFAIRLYRRKGQPGERNTIHLMLDEADSFAPQNPGKDQHKMLGAWEAIVRRGRSRGIGLTMVTQRPAVINKNVLSQVDLLVCLRIVGLHDFKAVSEWTNLYATKKQSEAFMQSLPTLKMGDAWFWSPGWLQIFERAQIAKKITFDSSRTPSPGEKAITPKKVAAVDLDHLSDQIKATVEKAEKSDPRKLQSRVRELEQLLAKKPAAAPTFEQTNKQARLSTINKLQKQLETAMQFLVNITAKDFGENVPTEELQTAVKAGVDLAMKRLEGIWQLRVKEIDKLKREANSALNRLKGLVDTDVKVDVQVQRQAPFQVNSTSRTNKTIPVSISSNGANLGAGEAKVLIAVAQYGSIERDTISVLTAYKRATRDAYIQRLRVAGLVEATQGGPVVLTESGRAALPADFEPLPIGYELQQYWVARLPQGERRIFEVMLEHGQSEVSREEIGDKTEFKRATRDAYLQRMRSKKIIEDCGPGMVRLSSNLF